MITACRLLLALLVVLPCRADPATDLSRLPLIYRYRCSDELRLTTIIKNGGTEASEEAVLKSLHFLKANQKEDGSWCEDHPVGMTGMALLCFFGRGENHQSEDFGDCIRNALNYLIKKARPNRGRMASDFEDKHWPYEHALAAQALAEGYLLCEKGLQHEIPHLKVMAQESLQFIIDHQHASGGWDYDYSRNSARGGDTSLTSWHLLALATGHLTDLELDGLLKTFDKGLAYLSTMQNRWGFIGYSSPNGIHGDGTTLTASAAYCSQLREKEGNELVRKAIPVLVKTMRFNWNSRDCDLYGHFFAAMALQNQGGTVWQSYHKMIIPQILANQLDDGSFRNLGGGARIDAVGANFAGSKGMAPIYRCCLCTLILESYYRRNPLPLE